MNKNNLLYMIVVLSYISCITASEKIVMKKISDIFYVYDIMIDRIDSYDKKKELYNVCTEGAQFFISLLNQNVSGEDLCDDTRKKEYLLMRYHFNAVMKKIHPSREGSLFLHTTMPLQQNYIVNTYDEMVELMSNSPDYACDTLSYLINEYDTFQQRYQNNMLYRKRIKNGVISKKNVRHDNYLFGSWMWCLKFFILPGW